MKDHHAGIAALESYLRHVPPDDDDYVDLLLDKAQFAYYIGDIGDGPAILAATVAVVREADWTGDDDLRMRGRL